MYGRTVPLCSGVSVSPLPHGPNSAQGHCTPLGCQPSKLFSPCTHTHTRTHAAAFSQEQGHGTGLRPPSLPRGGSPFRNGAGQGLHFASVKARNCSSLCVWAWRRVTAFLWVEHFQRTLPALGGHRVAESEWRTRQLLLQQGMGGIRKICPPTAAVTSGAALLVLKEGGGLPSQALPSLLAPAKGDLKSHPVPASSVQVESRVAVGGALCASQSRRRRVGRGGCE